MVLIRNSTRAKKTTPEDDMPTQKQAWDVEKFLLKFGVFKKAKSTTHLLKDRLKSIRSNTPQGLFDTDGK